MLALLTLVIYSYYLVLSSFYYYIITL